MAGSIESPLSADGLETLFDGTNVYGDDFEEYEHEMPGNDNMNNQLPQITPRSRDPPQSEYSSLQ